MLSPNGPEVIYPDAFTDFEADIRLTYSKAAFEQEIILRQRPPAPEEYGLMSHTARLQVWTESVQPPVPLEKQIRPDPLALGAAPTNALALRERGQSIVLCFFSATEAGTYGERTWNTTSPATSVIILLLTTKKLEMPVNIG